MQPAEEIAPLKSTIKQLIDERKFTVAAELIKLLLREKPGNPILIIWLIDVYLFSRQFEEAEKILFDLRDKHPEHSFAYFKLARVSIGRKNVEKAEGLIAEAESRLLAQQSTDARKWDMDTYLALANLYDERGEPDRARETRYKALELVPNSFKARRVLFSEWLIEGRLDKAMEVSNTALIASENTDESSEASRYVKLCQWAEHMQAKVTRRARAAKWPRPGRPGVVLAQAVWGPEYISIFQYHLQGLLAAGNIPELARSLDVMMVVVITETDLSTLRQSGILDAFEGIMDFEFVIIPSDLFIGKEQNIPPQIKYHLYAIGLHMGIFFAQGTGAGVSLLTADQINADGSFGHIARLIEKGCKGVFGTGMICNHDAFLNKLKGLTDDPAAPLTITPRELNRLAADCLHKFIERAIVSPSNYDFDNQPAALFWYSDDGLICHGFNLQPIYVGPEILDAYRPYCYERADGLVARRIFNDPALWKDVVVLDDSDKYCFVTLADEDKYPCSTGRSFDIELERDYVRNWHHVGELNMWLFRHKLNFRWPKDMCRKNEYDPATVEKILAARQDV